MRKKPTGNLLIACAGGWALRSLLRARFARLLVDFRKERGNNVCVQAKSAKQRRKSSFETPPVYPDLSTRLDWPQVKKVIVHLLSTFNLLVRWGPITRISALLRRRF